MYRLMKLMDKIDFIKNRKIKILVYKVQILGIAILKKEFVDVLTCNIRPTKKILEYLIIIIYKNV